ncbi:MAG: methyl-accepting chemotaxis protein [Azoarcus sp.]|jgi:methyl-accepting chemotaxis protein|nr:methyl-accepting chemotaxis protein [Azoarcus sp.]
MAYQAGPVNFKWKLSSIIGATLVIGLVVGGGELCRVMSKKAQFEAMHIDQLASIRGLQSILIYVNNMALHFNEIESVKLSSTDDKEIKNLKWAQDELQDDLNSADQQIQLFEPRGDEQSRQMWTDFVQLWTEWRAYDEDFSVLLNALLAHPSPKAIDEFYRYAAQRNGERRELTARLVYSLRDLVDTGFAQAEANLQSASRETRIASTIAVVIVLLALSMLAAFVLSARSAPATATVGKARDLLAKIANTHEFSEQSRAEIARAVASFDATIGELHNSLALIETRTREIDSGVEALAGDIRQLATDQINLFTFNAAIESARAQRSEESGFGAVADELCVLAEGASQFTGNIHNMATKIQVLAKEAIVELERTARQIEAAGRVATEVGSEKDPSGSEGDSNKIARSITAIAEALKVDPVRVVGGIVQLQATQSFSEALQEEKEAEADAPALGGKQDMGVAG